METTSVDTNRLHSGSLYKRPPGTHNATLTEVGQGTPMGELLRRYWQPVALARDATTTPKLIRALGEELILFRDKSGRPGLVHRIDKDTSGLLLISKNERSMTYLARQFYEHTIKRKYMALVWGDLEQDGTVTGYIGRSYGDRRVMDVYDDEEKGKWSVTHYKVLERMGYVTLIECQPETGRTHQIRAHMKHIGHPLFSDAMYGGDKILKGTVFSKYRQFVENCFELMPRQALHARSLGFVHPSTKKNIYFESALPQDFESVLKKWRNYTAATADQNL